LLLAMGSGGGDTRREETRHGGVIPGSGGCALDLFPATERIERKVLEG
jgi:hypothetical protein